MARSMDRLLAAAGIVGALMASAGSALAEVTVQNGLDRPVTIQFGYASPDGLVEWSPVTLVPCEITSVTEGPSLRLLFPRFADERLNPDTGTIDYELMLLDRPGRLFLFLADPRIMVDVMGQGGCDPAPAKPSPAPAAKPQAGT